MIVLFWILFAFYFLYVAVGLSVIREVLAVTRSRGDSPREALFVLLPVKIFEWVILAGVLAAVYGVAVLIFS